MRWGGEGSRAGGRFAALAGPLPGSAKGNCDIVDARKCRQGVIMAMVKLLVLVIMNNYEIMTFRLVKMFKHSTMGFERKSDMIL